MLVAVAAIASAYAEDIARDVKKLTNVKGTLAIDSAKVKAGQPTAKIEWTGNGELKQKEIGKHGYVIFRYQATDWWDKHDPLVNLTAPFSLLPNPKKKTRFKDRLYAGVKRKDVNLTIDGTKCDGPDGKQGGRLWNTTKPQTAYWDIKVDDDKEHVLTILTCYGALMTYSVAPLSNPTAKQKLISLDEKSGAAVIQFTFKGSIRLILDQTAFTTDDLGKGKVKRFRKQANISAIFVD